MRIHLFKNCLSLLRGSLLALAGLAACQAQAQVQGITDTEILLGSHQDLSGPLASLGAPFRDGLILAAEEINAAGGIHGRKVRVVVEDNGYDPKKAVLATQKLLTRDKVFAIIATLGTATSTASMPLTLDRGVPFLFPGSASEATYLPYQPLKFAFTTPYGPQVGAAIKHAYEKLGKRRFGILYQDDESGQSVLRSVEEQLKGHGLSLLERTSYKRGEIDFSTQIARLKAANVDVVMLMGNTREAASAKTETKKQGWPVDMMAGSGASSAATIKLGGEAVEGLYVSGQWMNSAQEMTPALQAIRDRYKARFGQDMQDGVNQTYVSMMLFAEGARNAGRNLTPQTLQQGLERVKNFKTVFETVPISYAPGNHMPPMDALIMQVKGGKWVLVSSATAN
jgi:ABC-type branched-subunit amino acid transport system substrate-binding protein